MSAEDWDRAAATFDEEPDHGLSDPSLRSAWRDLLVEMLPALPGRIADLGCGTGTLSQVLVAEGFSVDGVDFSPEMVRRARLKVPQATLVVADAATPPLRDGRYDVVLSRHVLWALPEPVAVVQRWAELLTPGGLLVLIEGRWGTGVGLTADQATEIVRAAGLFARVRHLPEARFWGREIDDERYVLTAR